MQNHTAQRPLARRLGSFFSLAAIALSLAATQCSKSTTVVPDACLENQFRCENGTLKRCNANRTGYDIAQQCSPAEQCSETLGACVAPPDPPKVTACTPKKTEECFEGKTELAGVGACTKGTRTCSDDGAAFGACAGSGKQSAQSCANKDENCDGVAGCTGDLLGGIPLGVLASHVRVDGVGNRYIAGNYTAAATLLGAPLPQGQQGDFVVAKVDVAGKLVWKYVVAGIGGDDIRDLILDADGNVILLGTFATGNQGDLKIGATTLRSFSIGVRELFAAKLTGAAGTPVWATRFESSGYDWRYSPAKLALGSAGNVFVATSGNSNLDVYWGADQSGNKSISVPNGLEAIYFVELTGGGTFVHSYAIDCSPTNSYDSALTAFATRIGAPGAISSVYAAMRCKSATWAPNNNPRAIESPEEYSLVKLNQVSSGALIPDGTGAGRANAIAVNAQDHVFAGGDVPAGVGKTAFSVRRLDAGLIAPAWVVTARNPQNTSSVNSVALDAFDNIVATGPCSGFLALDPNGARGDITGEGICVAKYSAAGDLIWAKTLPATVQDLGTSFGDVTILGVAIEPLGGISISRQQLWSLRP